MIFFFHLVSFIFGCLGLIASYILTNYSIFKNIYIKLFIIIFCISIAIHVLILDPIGNGTDNFVKYCVNLEGWEGEMKDDKKMRFQFLISELFKIHQPTLNEKNGEYHSWTKAIYANGYLQDFLIECQGVTLMRVTPTGEPIFVGLDWNDSRDDYMKNRWCE